MNDIKPIQILLEKRKKSKEMGRIIHPDPLIKEIRLKRKRFSKLELPGSIFVNRFGDFIENVGKSIREPENWESAVAGQIIGMFLGKILP